MVKSIADELVSAGLVGRADHIGVHPFQDKRHRLLIGRRRPDLVLFQPNRTYIIEVEASTGLRGNALLNRIIDFLELNYWVGIICHKEHASALRTAFLLQTNERVPYIGSQKEVLEILYKELKLPDRYAGSKHNAK